MTKEDTTAGEEQTEALGVRLGQLIQPGAVIAYTGDLGSGKTAFTRGLARGLGIPDRVTSPTFTIVNEYEGGRLPLFHFDMYRLGSSDQEVRDHRGRPEEPGEGAPGPDRQTVQRDRRADGQEGQGTDGGLTE